MSTTELARADEENGCEACWDALRADLKSAGLPDPVNLATFAVPAGWVGRACEHDAPAYAPSILVPAGRS